MEYAIYILVAVLLMLLLFAVLRRKYYYAASLLLALVICNIQWDLIPLHICTTPISSLHLKVLSYNIYPYDESIDIDDWQKQVFQEIKEIDPDILCLQEFKYYKYNILLDSLYSFFQYDSIRINERKMIKGAIYSKYPLRNIRKYGYATPVNKSLAEDFATLYGREIRTDYLFYSADVELPNNATTTVFCCHLMSNGITTMFRKAQTSPGSFISNVFDASRIGNEIRKKESQVLRKCVDSIASINPIIVAGDFNASHLDPVIENICGNQLSDAWVTKGFGPGFTYRNHGLFLRIDHIMYSKELDLQNVGIISSNLSDHKPLVAEFNY